MRRASAIRPASLVTTLLLAAGLLGWAPASLSAAPLRAGVFVGSNAGVFGEEDLFYAPDDALKVYRAFLGFGALDARLAFLLRDVSRAEVLRAVDELRERVALVAAHGGGRGVECVFYYSGHGGSDGLHLDGETLPYDELHRRLDALGCSLLVVILDACHSGALFRVEDLRLKGFTFTDEEFRVQVYDTRQGAVYITSAAESEFSQERDGLRGSVFTYHLVHGLLGAADANGDARVTLGEAYEFASRGTVRDTFDSARGLQVPAYRYDVRGSHDVVLTEVGGARRRVVPPAGTAGTLTFMDEEQGIVWGDFAASEAALVPPGGYLVRLSATDGSRSLARCTVDAAGAASWGAFAPLAEGDDPLKGQRSRHRAHLRLTGGAMLSPDATVGRHVSFGGELAFTIDNLGYAPLYAGVALRVQGGSRDEAAFDVRYEASSAVLLGHALLGLQYRFSRLFELAGEVRLGGGYAWLKRELPARERATSGALLDVGGGVLATWWLGGGMGLVLPAVDASALTSERGGRLHTTLGVGLTAGIRLLF